MPGSDTAIADPTAVAAGVNPFRSVRPPIYRGIRPYVVTLAFLALLYGYRYYRVDNFAGSNRANLVIFYAIIVIGFYYIFGISGRLAFCQSAFVGVGAYASNWGSQNHSFVYGMATAIIVSAGLSFALAWLLRRTDHFYFAIASLAFAEVAQIVFRNWKSLTGTSLTGGDISGAKPIEILGYTFDNDLRIFTLFFGLLGVLLVLCAWFVRSPMRREAVAARDNAMVSRALGVPVQSLYFRTFVVGSTIAGIAGSLFVHWNGFANADSFGLDLMLAIFLMLVIGGANSYWGGVIGAVFYVYVPVFIERLEQYQQIFYGALLMITMIVMPNGIIGLAGQIRRAFYRFVLHKPAPETGHSDSPLARLLRMFPRRALTEPMPNGKHGPSMRVRQGLDVPANAPAVLDAENIQVHFGGVKAVDGVSLGLGTGEILGLVGPNGSGKSSFLNAVTGVVPAGGSLVVGGKPVRLGKPRAVWDARVLRTFQTPQTFLDLTCLENALLGVRDRKFTGFLGSWLLRPVMLRREHARWAVAERALERFGLGAFAERSAAGLAYGQQRMLELARVYASEPDVILLDEPSAGLNAAETEALAHHLLTLRADGVSLLVVDHKIDFITSICDRVAVLEWGQLVTVGTPEDVWQDERVVAAYLGTD